MPEPADASAQQGTTDQQGGDNTAAQTGTQQTGDATGSSGTNGGNAERRYTQAEVDAVVKERLDRERRKAEEKAQADREEAERKRAEEEGRWKDLAGQHEAKVRELEPRAQTAETERDTYRSIVLSQQQAAIDALPEPLQKLAPTVSDAPTLAEINARAAFLTNAADAAAAFGSQHAHTTGGVPATPKPANGQATTAAQTQDRQQQFASTAYSLWGKR